MEIRGAREIPGKQLVSIVDDDSGVRESLKSFILSLGYVSGTFATAEEYLESELLHGTACLISDVQLPGMSGPDLQARLIADGHRIPTVFVTGFVNETIRTRVLTAGAVGYFAKPLDPGVLIECLEKALASIPS
jgi:FixJ family two-component response regulator